MKLHSATRRAACLMLCLLLCRNETAAQEQSANLGSTSHSSQSFLPAGQQVVIRVGGKAFVVDSTTMLTPAQQVAVNQVLSGGLQSLIIGGEGNAVGGSFNLTKDVPGTASGLLIPDGVSGMLNMASASTFQVQGTLTNCGKLYAFSTNPAVASGTIVATDIFNQHTGLLTTIVPQSLAAGIVPQFDLTLSALNSIVNNGTMSGVSSISLLAGNAIINAPSSAVMPAPLIQALHDVNLSAATVTNGGVIESLSGSVNIQALAGQSLLVMNTGGSIQAHGDINVSSPGSSALVGIDLLGGDFLSQHLNIDAGSGYANGSIGEVSGWINIAASCSQFGAATSHLKLGEINISGDPTFFNTSGSLTLSNIANTAGAHLALIASQDVIVTGGTIDTTNFAGGNGGSLTIIAGAEVSSSALPSGNNDTTTTLTITQSALSTHGSATGGAIDLSGVTQINTAGTLLGTNLFADYGGNGGNILMVAFDGSGAGSTLTPGTVNAGSSGTMITAGAGTGIFGNGNQNGNITIIAGAANDPAGGSAIALPALFTGATPGFSQAGLGGNVDIFTATPVITGNPQVLAGALSGGNIIPNATMLPTSISVESVGGADPVPVNNALSAWQIAVASYALGIINADRAAAGLGPLTVSPILTQIASDQAAYMASTAHYSHFDLLGGSPSNRAQSVGVDTSATGFAENTGYSLGPNSPQNVFVGLHSFFMSEPNSPGTHHFNLVGTAAAHNNYIGIGFAQVGGTIYLVENFTVNDPGAGNPSIPSVPVYAGVSGAAGVIPAAAGSNKTIGAVGGNAILPTSIMSYGNVTVSAGKDIDVTGSILANGTAGNQKTFGNSVAGKNGGAVNISAGGDINLFNIQSSGGAAGTSTTALAQVLAGIGGTVNVASQNGNISIVPGGVCAFCPSVSVAGGAGAQALAAGAAGGAGGSAGVVTLTAANGTISLTGIEAGGGGGGGGGGGTAGATAGGAGGGGGAGGSIALSAKGVNVENYLNASGGGGGGAGGSGADGGGGGGGGAFSMSGGGGTAGSASAGGGGGGGAQIAAFGGPSTSSQISSVSGAAGQNGSLALGGLAGVIGGGGGGGGGVTATQNGGDGGDVGQAGAASGSVFGGAAGAGGNITLDSALVAIEGTVSNSFASYPVKHGGASLLALGSGGTVDIANTGGALSIVYSQFQDYTSTNQNIPVVLGTTFTVGSVAGGNGTEGIIESGQQGNSITINSTSSSSPVTSGTFILAGAGTVTITEGGLPVMFTSGASNATPAEIVAIYQVLSTQPTPTQPLILDANGAASSGSLTVALNNIPAGGFTELKLPTGVTLYNESDSLSYSVGATVDGSMVISAVSGTATVSTPSLSIGPAGSISNSSGSLNIQGAGPGNSLSIAFGNGGLISTSDGDIALNGTNAGAVTTTSAGLGAISAGGAGSLIVFNGGSGSVNVSLNAALGAVSGSGDGFDVSVDSGSLATGVIGSASTVQLSAASGIVGTGLVSAGALIATSVVGDISISSSTSSVTVSTAGSVVLTNNKALSIAASSAGSSLSISATGAIVSAGQINANQILLQTTANNADITLGSNLNGTGLNSQISISAHGGGSIIQTTGSIGADSIQMTSTTGNIGAAAQAIVVNAADLTASTGGAGGVFLSNSSGGVSIGQSAAGSTFQLASAGAISTSGSISASVVTFQTTGGSNAGITIDNPVGSVGGTVNITADGSGDVSGSGLLLGSVANLSSGTGSIGTAGQALNTNAASLSVNTGGSSVISNTAPTGNNVSIGPSMVGGSFSLTNNNSINIDSAVSSNGVSLTATAGSININADLTSASGTVVLAAGGSGVITQLAGTVVTGALLTASSGSGSITLNNLSVSGVDLSTSGDASLQVNTAVVLGAVNVGGTFLLQDPVSIASGGIVTVGAGTIVTPLLTVSNAMSATNGSLVIQSPAWQNLTLAGSGTLAAPVGNTITIDSGSGDLEFAGNLSMSAPTVNLVAANAIQVDVGIIVNVTGNLIATAGTIFNPGGFSVTGGTATFNVAPAGNSVGTLANSNGNIVLAGNTIVNSAGKHLLIIASGDVLASGLSSINLGSTTSRGGNLTILAGMDFAPATAGQQLSTGITFTVLGTSSTGGSINLSKTSINTASAGTFGSGNVGGNVTMVSSAVPGASAGVILVGGIKTTSTAASAGSVKLIAPGGIQVAGGIDASGATAGGSVLLAGTPANHGTIKVSNGYLAPAANFSAAAAVNGSAAGVSVSKGITTSSKQGAGGNVTIVGESQIKVGSSITTSGQTTSGSVSISSLNGAVNLGGSINASGKNGFGGILPGKGGDFTLSVPQFASIKGNILTYGGSMPTLVLQGASGGNVTMQTSTLGNAAQGFFTGNISVGGYINSSGGSANTALFGGKGGAAGQVLIKTGALQVKGKLTKASIFASGGKGFAGSGANGNVSINTYAVQSLPSDLNLTSTVLSQYVLPGGLFTVGAASPVNGVAGSIVSGNSSFTSSNGAWLSSGTFSQGLVTIAITGGTQSIQVGSNSVLFSPATGALRNKVTPAQAVALYQVALGGAQTLELNALGQAACTNAGSPSTIDIAHANLPPLISRFVLQAQGTASGIILNVSGASPVLNLPSGAVIAGEINFTDNTGPALISTGQLTLVAGGSLTSAGQIAIASKSIKNSGTINASQVVMYTPKAAVTLANTSTGVINAGQIVLPTNGLPSSMKLTNSGGSVNAALTFSSMQVGTGYGASVSGMTPGAAASTAFTLNLSMTGGAQLGGSLSAGRITVNTTSVNVNGVSVPTDLILLAGTSLNAGTALTLKSNAALIVGPGCALSSAKSLSISAVQQVQMAAGSSASLQAGTLTISSQTLAILDGDLTAGALNGTPGITTLLTGDIASKGAISVKAPSVQIGSSVQFTSNGGNLTVTASAGGISMGFGNAFRANGGNLIMLASADISGTTGNGFVAMSVGPSGSSKGGGIELGAGTLSSSIAKAQALGSGDVVGTFASNFLFTNPGSGAVYSNVSNLNVNVSSSGANVATFNFTGGAIAFDAKGASTVSLDGATFSVAGYKPVAYSSVLLSTQEELVVPGSRVLAHLFVPGCRGMQVLSGSPSSKADGRYTSMAMHGGEMFLCPRVNTVLRTKYADVQARKGALLLVSIDPSGLTVINCGAGKDVQVVAGPQAINLLPGEELLIGDQRITENSCEKTDGIGRRNARSFELATGLYASLCEVSIFSLMSNLPHLDSLKRPGSVVERKIANTLLKTALALNLVGAHRGAYSALTRSRSLRRS